MQNESQDTLPPAASSTAKFWLVVAAIVALDASTKALAVAHLAPRYFPREIIGEYVRFTLAYNPGAAFGMHIGPSSRWFFAVTSVIIVLVLLRQTAQLTRISRLAAIGVPIVIGGAFGNLLDRGLYREGVVDFIDIGTGGWRFWTFNVADIAITIGAACLIVALWQTDPERQDKDLQPQSVL